MTARNLFSALALLALGAWAALGGGAARAQDYEAGMAAYEAGDYQRAVGIWDPLASTGDATAQYSLGKIYETGNSELPRDYGRAVEWYRLASAQGVAAAQNNLGLMYAQGRGVARDAGRATELWGAAAKQNHAMAQFNLGLAHFRGEGVIEDKTEAETWFRHAAELGLADAQYALGQIKLHGLTAPADQGEALAWYQLAAAQGHRKAREQAESLREEGVKPKLAVDLSPAAPGASLAQAAAPATPSDVPETAIAAPPTARIAQAPAPLKADPPHAVPAPASPAKTAVAKAAAPAKPPSQAAATPMQPAGQKPAAAQPARIEPQLARAGAGAVPVASGGRFRAWLYSARTEGEAIGYLREIENQHKSLLTGVDGAVMPAQFGDQEVLYRVVAGGFASWQDGRAWCLSLRQAAPSIFCKVLPARRAAN